MEKLTILLKLSYKFSKKYLKEYLIALAKPLLIGFIGMALLFIGITNPNLIIFSLLSIPCVCYSFWKGYVITYALIPCANDFIKEAPCEFEKYTSEIKKNEAKFAGYVGFVAVLSIILYLPCALWIIKSGILTSITQNPFELVEISKSIDNAIMVNSLVIAAFLNFALCAYFYKKEEENYFDLFLNCFRKSEILGLFIALLITFISLKGGVLYVVASLILNPFIYSINTFYYSSRIKK